MRLFQKLFLEIITLIAVILFFQEISKIRITSITDQLGPQIVPAVLCVFIYLTSSVLIISSDRVTNLPKLKQKKSMLPWGYFGILIVYILLLQGFGFLVASLLYAEISVLILGRGNVTKKLFVYSSVAIIVCFVFFVFEYLLNIDLPKGLFMNGSI